MLFGDKKCRFGTKYIKSPQELNNIWGEIDKEKNLFGDFQKHKGAPQRMPHIIFSCKVRK